jgi:hypothetical protein
MIQVINMNHPLPPIARRVLDEVLEQKFNLPCAKLVEARLHLNGTIGARIEEEVLAYLAALPVDWSQRRLCVIPPSAGWAAMVIMPALTGLYHAPHLILTAYNRDEDTHLPFEVVSTGTLRSLGRRYATSA